MLKKSRCKKRGFAYIVAIGMLGLLAFMGLFLIQSSSTEYSQTAISVYRTMGRQLAEAAAEEAAVMIEERFKDKSSTGYFDQLLKQASTSGPMRMGGTTGLNPSFLNDFNNLKDKVTQTLALRDYHVSRVGFVIDKILPTIKDLRPIPQGPLDIDFCYTNDIGKSCYYTPKDRFDSSSNNYLPFDSRFSKDWYCTLQLDVTLSLNKQHKTTINYQISKDIKIVNVGPIARNYTFYSILGAYVSDYSNQTSVQNALLNSMNGNGGVEERGRLILWNVPFQSRVFMHGPVILRLENPTYESMYQGAFNSPPNQKGPGPNMAYQYSDTFYGFSYFPLKNRCLFPNSKSLSEIWGSVPTKDDEAVIKSDYRSFTAHKTASEGGLYPESDTGFWSRVGDTFTQGWKNTYYVGKNLHQMFLPAGPFCRFPWHYTPKEAKRQLSPFRPNQLDPPPIDFPTEDPDIRIEHRWNPNDSDVEEKTRIYAEVSEVTYRELLGSVGINRLYTEFSLNYYNNEEIDGFFSKLWASVVSVGGTVFNAGSLGLQAAFDGIQTLTKHFFKKDDTKDADEETEFANLFPTNFKYNYMQVVTRHLNDETEIPLDSEGRWILNGIYWLDSLKIEAPITYIGTGTLIVCRNTPLVIKGDVVCARDSNGNTLGHLTIFYHPHDDDLFRDLAQNKAYNRMLTLDSSTGEGIMLEASVYSLCGIRCKSGENISLNDCANPNTFGVYPEQPLDKWEKASDGTSLKLWKQVLQNCNCIVGNYVNYYTILQTQYDQDPNNDLWVIHNYLNPLYYKKTNDKGYIMIQEYLDSDENERFAYEKSCHEFFMSPKIQHIGVR